MKGLGRWHFEVGPGKTKPAPPSKMQTLQIHIAVFWLILFLSSFLISSCLSLLLSLLLHPLPSVFLILGLEALPHIQFHLGGLSPATLPSLGRTRRCFPSDSESLPRIPGCTSCVVGSLPWASDIVRFTWRPANHIAAAAATRKPTFSKIN